MSSAVPLTAMNISCHDKWCQSLTAQYAEMWSRQKETGALARSISTASMSSATTSRAADGEGSIAGDNPRRVSRGIVGTLFGGAQAMLGYGGGGAQASSEASHGPPESHE